MNSRRLELHPMQPIIYQSDEEENSKRLPKITRKCQFGLFGDIVFFIYFFPICVILALVLIGNDDDGDRLERNCCFFFSPNVFPLAPNVHQSRK